MSNGAGSNCSQSSWARQRRATIIAVVGIDGAGKSTAVQGLAARYAGDASVMCVSRKRRPNFERVCAELPSDFKRPASYANGPFAEAIRVAHALDFLEFYREEIEPLLWGNVHIVSDRLASCALAFSASVPSAAVQAQAILREVARPDRILWLRVAPTEARRRIMQIRTPNTDEDLPLLQAFERGYATTLAHDPTVVSATPASLSAAVNLLESALAELRISGHVRAAAASPST